jgi:hypothetical protein
MMRSTALACLLLLSSGADAQDERPAAPPMEVTTDTQSYCRTLAQQISQYRDLPPEIVVLRDQGRRLCADGNVRGGINRLRRVLMVLRHDDQDREPGG